MAPQVITPDQLQAQTDAQIVQANDAHAAKQAAEASGPAAPPTLLEKYGNPAMKWTTGHLYNMVDSLDKFVKDQPAEQKQNLEAARRVGADITSGTIKGGVWTADAIHAALGSLRPDTTEIPSDVTPPKFEDGLAPIWEPAKKAMLNFADQVAVKDPNMVDNFTQLGAQLAGPFGVLSRLTSYAHDATLLRVLGPDIAQAPGLAGRAARWITRSVTSNAVGGGGADAIAQDPHQTRMSDVALAARQTENALTPIFDRIPGSMDQYIRMLAHSDNESDASGRLKNLIEGASINGALGPAMDAMVPMIMGAVHSIGHGLDIATTAMRHDVHTVGDMLPEQLRGEPPQPVAPGAAGSGDTTAKYNAVAAKIRQLGAQYKDDVANPEYIRQVTPLHEQLMKYSEAATDKSLYGSQQGGMERRAAVAGVPPGEERRVAPDANVQKMQDMMARNAAMSPARTVSPPRNQDDLEVHSAPSFIGHKPLEDTAEWLRGAAEKGTVFNHSRLMTVLHSRLPEGQDGDFYRDILDRLRKHPDVVNGAGVQAGDDTAKLVFSKTEHPLSNTEGHGTIDGEYDPTTHTTTIFPSAMTNPSKMVHTIAHEGVHAATFWAMRENPGVLDAMDSIADQLRRHEAMRDVPHPYGFKNGDELFAETESNPGFVDVLRALDMPASQTRPAESAWDRVKWTVGGMLGLSAATINSPMFDALLTPQGKEKPGA